MQQQDDRITKLETKISYQEMTIQELSAMIANQEKRLSRLEERDALLTGKVQELMEILEESPVDEKPPHY
jgi:SlyX protein